MDAGGARTLKSIGEDVHKWCDINGVSQEELAEILGVSSRTVHNIWYGVHAPSLPTRQILAAIMHKSVDFFVETMDPETEKRLRAYEQRIRNRNGGRIKDLPSVNEEDELDRRMDAAAAGIKAVKQRAIKEYMVQASEHALQAAKLIKMNSIEESM